MKVIIDDELWQAVRAAALRFVGEERFAKDLDNAETPEVPTNLADAIILREQIKKEHTKLRRINDEDAVFYFLCRQGSEEKELFLYQLRIEGILVDSTNIRKRLREWEKNDGMGYAEPTPMRPMSDYVLDPWTQYTHINRRFLHCLPWEEE